MRLKILNLMAVTLCVGTNPATLQRCVTQSVTGGIPTQSVGTIKILKRLMAIQQDDFKTLREYVSMLEILASNRNLNLDIQQEFEMLEIEIEKLPSFLIGEKRGIEQGIEQGENNKAIMIAKQLIKLSLSLTEIAQITGLTVDELEKLG